MTDRFFIRLAPNGTGERLRSQALAASGSSRP
jgi:hypothetical protein